MVRKSQPKITGVDKCSTTTRVWSTLMMPKSNFAVVVPRGVNFLPSAFISVIVSDFTKSARRMWSTCMTEQDAPESSNICVSQLFILPTTQAVLIALECEGDSAGKQSMVRVLTGIWEHLLLDVRRCPLGRFPNASSFWLNAPFFHSYNILYP